MNKDRVCKEKKIKILKPYTPQVLGIMRNVHIQWVFVWGGKT